MPYSRAAPSPRYTELLALYRDMHLHGDPSSGLSPAMTFNGISLRPHVNRVRALIRQFGARTLLDYGCGKAGGYDGATVQRANGAGFVTLREFWELDEIALFDPAVGHFGTLPDRRFDAVISTDVLEHCPQDDIEWIVAEMFAHAAKFVFATVALYPASKRLPGGANAHVTLREGEWWIARFTEAARRSPGVRFLVALMESPADMTEVEGPSAAS